MTLPASQLYPSPFRYPGGKRKLSNYVKLLMLQNDLVGSEYVEPYAGGASVALSLLFEEYATHIHINDLNPSIHAFWSAVLSEPEEMCRRIAAVEVTVDEWQRQRAIQDQDKPEEIDLAFSTFFLNRTSRSGVIGGGIIGGYKQKGKWKIDARFNRDDLIQRIRKIARFASRISVTGIDAADFLKSRLPELERPFLYLDPPYYAKGADLYQSFYRHDDHQGIASLVAPLKVPWIVSYDATVEIESMYEGFRSVRYDLYYSAADRYHGSEVMFFSNGLDTPDIESPAGISYRYLDEARRAVA
jgi:DNA adenine methylase